jgi:hypothetical protein
VETNPGDVIAFRAPRPSWIAGWNGRQRWREPVAIPELRDDARFPMFTPRALDAGLAAVFTFPIETAKQRHKVIRLGRGSCQGHNFARPTPAADLDDLIQKDQRVITLRLVGPST